MTTLYEKRGRRYHPVQDTLAIEGLRNGHWLVSIQDGWTHIRRLVEPDHAGFLAAARDAEPAMLEALRRASEQGPRDEVRTRKHEQAWRAVREILGPDHVFWLERAAARDIVDAGLEAVRAEWEKRKQYVALEPVTHADVEAVPGPRGAADPPGGDDGDREEVRGDPAGAEAAGGDPRLGL